MAIIQISKIQQRSGNLVDLPQLDEAEFGWATDAKRLYIGKTTPNENIEVLTSYSRISFSQIDGSVGNLNISNVTAANGQVLTYDGTNWVNRGGIAGGLITLGDVANIRIDGGSTGFVLQTDGSGNLSWSPKNVITANIQNVTKANPAVVTTAQNHYFSKGAQITITNAQGMTQLNGNVFYANVLTSNTFSLYTDSGLTATLDSSAYSNYIYTTVTATATSGSNITVGTSTPFSLNAPVKFAGNILANSGGTLTLLDANTTYYIKSKPSSTRITVSDTLLPNGVAGNTVALGTVTSLSAAVYQIGGLAVASAGATTFIGNAAGTNTMVQYANATGQFGGSSTFTFDYTNNILTVNGNSNVGNLNASSVVTASRLVSNVATGTAPLTVTSTTRVANLNVNYSNVSDYGAVTARTTGTFYPVFVSGNTTANYQLGVVSTISINAATGNITATNFLGRLANGTSNINIPDSGGNINLAVGATAKIIATSAGANVIGTLGVSGNANIANIGTAGLIVATGNVTGGNLVTSGQLSVTGNANIGNIGTAGLIVATGNVTGGNLVTGGSLSVTGNSNVGNIGSTNGIFTGNVTAGNANVTGQLISTIAVGTAPLVVTSTTRVENLNVSRANVSDNTNVSSISSGVVYPVFVDTNTTGNYNLKSNVAVSFDIATGTLTLDNIVNNANITSNNITVSNIANIGSDLIVAGEANIAGNANIIANVNVVKNINVTGNANISGNGRIDSNLVINNNLVVANYANVGTTLNVFGNGNISGNINLSGNLITTSNINASFLTLTNTANITANLNVNGNIITNSNLAVSGVLTVTGDATVGNITSAGGIFTANITSANANLGNTAIANYFVGDGGLLSNISLGSISSIINGTSNVVVDNNSQVRVSVASTPNVVTFYAAGANINGYANITGNANVGNLNTTGNIISSGNVTFTGANISLGSVANVKVTGGTSGFVLVTDGTGNLTFANPGTLGTQPAGINTQIQYNDSGSLGANSGFTFNKVNGNLAVPGNIIASANVSGANGVFTNANSVNLTVTSSANILGTANVTGNTNAGNVNVTGRLVSTVATGTAPLVVNSTTQVANLNAATAGSATTAGTVTTAAQPNITSLGTLTTLTVSGNSNVGNIGALGGYFTTVTGSLTTNAQPNITTVGTLIALTVTGNTGVGNLVTGQVVASNTVDATTPNSGSTGGLRLRGNSTSGQAYLQITDSTGTVQWGVLQSNSSGNLGYSGSFSAVGNISAGNLTTAGMLNASGNANVGNLNNSGNIVSTGNITVTSGQFNGNGAGLTNVPYAATSGISDSSNNVSWSNVSGRPTALSSFTNDVGYITSPFPAGTKMLFAQTTAPVGWTKLTTTDDAALRVVSGAAGSGGSVNFTTAFTSRSVTGTVGGTALTENQMPVHRHVSGANFQNAPDTTPAIWGGTVFQTTTTKGLSGGATSPSNSWYTDYAGGGQTHSHTFSGTSINLAVKYVDVIIAQKD